MEKPLMQLLKDDTRGKHTEAEAHPFQGALAQGKLPFESYCQYLVYLTALHRGFEGALRDKAVSDSTMQQVVKPEHYQVEFLENDLAALNLSVGDKNPSPAIESFLQQLSFASEPVSLLGVLYVLLGSKHGAKFIAHSVRQAYGFNGGGYSYFDPYGSEFKALWQSFVSSMNDLSLTEKQRESVLETARLTFEVFSRMGEEIWDRQSSPSLPR